MSKPPPLRPLFNEKSSVGPEIPLEKKNVPKNRFWWKYEIIHADGCGKSSYFQSLNRIHQWALFDCNRGWKFEKILTENRATFLIWWVSPNLSLSWLELQWYLADTLFLRFLAFFEPVFRALLDNIRKCRIYEKRAVKN